MSKFTLTLVTLFATVVILSLSSTAANAQPTPTALAQAKTANYCSDPWITTAVWSVTGGTRNPSGVGIFGECNPKLYNYASWNNYNQLLQLVGVSLSAISSQAARFTMIDIGNNQLQIKTDLGGGFASTATVSGHIVSQGAGNIVSQGAGNLISQDGASIILNGGGNYKVQSVNQKSLNLPNNYVLVVTRPATPPPPPTAYNGVCANPLVTKAITAVTGRAPNGSGNTGACLTTLYGGGQWSNYTDLVMKVGTALRWPLGTCSDAWIIMATLDVKGQLPVGIGTTQQCAPANYSGGSWKSYNGPLMPSLINGVKAYWHVL